MSAMLPTRSIEPSGRKSTHISNSLPAWTESKHFGPFPHTERHPETLTEDNVLVQVPPSPILPVKSSWFLRVLTGEGMDFVISPPISQKQSVHASVSIWRCADEGGQDS